MKKRSRSQKSQKSPCLAGNRVYNPRMIRPSGVMYCLLIGSGLAAQTVMPGGEEVAVRKAISDFADAWNRHDAKAMAQLHTEDVNFVNIFGQWWRGRSEVEAGLRRGHITAFSKSKMLVNTEVVKFLAPNIALVQGTMELLDAPPETLGRCHSSRVLVKENGRWLISSFQNTLIRAGDPAAPKQ
jgi:uncharacterized protein (TIGR02246 family)